MLISIYLEKEFSKIPITIEYCIHKDIIENINIDKGILQDININKDLAYRTLISEMQILTLRFSRNMHQSLEGREIAKLQRSLDYKTFDSASSL